MGKYLVFCSIVILFVLLQTEVIMSLSRRGSSRPSGGGRGSHHKPSRPVHQPSKPSRPVHQPSKPSRPVHQPSKPSRPVHQPSNPVHKPIKPVQNPVKPVQEVPVQSARQPVQPVQNPMVPQNKPANNPPPYNPAYQPPNPANPAQNPVVPQNKPANNPPPYNPAYQPPNPANPAQNPAYPAHNPANPAYPPHNPANPAQNPAYPAHNPANPAYPPHNPVNPAQNPAYPPHNPANPAYPPHNPANPAYPPHNPANPAYPPHNPANPAYPPHNPANPAQNPAYPPHNPANPAYPPHNPANPAQNPAYPPHNPANPAQNPAYPPHNPGYPQHNPANPPPNPGYPHNPNYPQNPSYPHHNPGYPPNPNYPLNPKWGHYDAKPWKPKPPKTNLKHMAGAAAVGALGGFFLGRAMSNMHFNFRNPAEERWWYENRNRYSDQVYYPKYEHPVPADVFVRDCWNITVREFIEPSGNETADEMERRVVPQVVHEMCVQQYRSYSGQAEGGSVIHNPHIQEPNPSNPVMKHTQGEAVAAGPAVENTEASLGSPMGHMHFRFNDSEEQQWWNENRHRFMDRVFQPNYSQPVPMDVFVSDCVNATMGEYTKPSGNETANETETRVLKRLVPEMCMELYHNYSRHSEKEMVYSSNKKVEESIKPARLAMTDSALEPNKHTAPNNSAMSMYFHSTDALLLPSMLLGTVLSTRILIP